MPAGNTPQLQIPLMAESDNQKYLAFNDAIQALDDSLNRLLVLDFTTSDLTLTEAQLTRYQCFRATGNTIPRVLNVPTTVGGLPSVTTNRFLIIDNRANAAITVTHGVGLTVIIPATTVTLVYCDGTDIASVASASGFDMGVRVDGGVDFVSNPTFLNFAGNGVTAILNGLGADITVTLPQVLDDSASQQTDTAFFDFTGSGVTVTPSGSGATINIPGGAAGINFQDEGVTVASGATTVDFAGSNVDVTDNGGDALVTISSAAAQDEGLAVSADPTFFNFIGAGVVATANGTGVDVTVAGAGSTGVDVEEAGVSAVTGATLFNFLGANVSVADVAGDAHVTVKAPTIQDESVPVVNDPTFVNFIGSGVTATAAAGGGIDVTIPGSSGTAIPVDDDTVNVLTAADRFNFTGAGVTVTANGTTADIDISNAGGAVEIQDEGTQVAATATTVNFTGPGVTASSPAAGVVDVEISGGGGSSNTSASIFWEDIGLVNGDFENGATGWTTDVGTFVSEPAAGGYAGADNGSFVYGGGAGGNAQAAVSSYQDFDVSTDVTIFAYDISAVLMKDVVDSDKAFVELSLLDVSGNVLSASRMTDEAGTVGQRPVSTSIFSHPEQVTLRVRIGVDRATGTNNNAALDNVQVRKASIGEPAADTASSQVIKTIDFAATPVPSFTVPGIDKYDEIQIVIRNAANNDDDIRMRMSTDGGTTFDATVGNYPYRFNGVSNGNVTTSDFFEVGSTASSGAQSVITKICNAGQLTPTEIHSVQLEGASIEFTGFFDQAAVTNALEIYNGASENFTAGEVYIIGVRYSKGTSYSSPVAFHATNTAGSASSGVQNFPNEVLDEGGDFDVSNGTFTAPVGGIYHLYGAAIIDGGATTGTTLIRVNGVPQSRGYFFSGGSIDNSDHSVALTIRLVPGDEVTFETSFSMAASTDPWNYFGGYLLNASTGNAPFSVFDETANALTSVQEHGNAYVVADDPTTISYVINDDTLYNHDVGTTITIEQAGAGTVTVSGSAGVTIRSSASLSTRTQYSVIMVTKVAADTWTITGDLAP